MTHTANFAMSAVMLVAATNVIWAICKVRRSTLNTVWILFCISLGLAMLERLVGDSHGTLNSVTRVAGGGACGIFWLVARSLFRPGKAISALHWLLVAAIIAPTVIAPTLVSLPMDAQLRSTLTGGLWNFQLLFSSTAMVLSAWEGINGWHARLSPGERRLRIAYVGTIGACVMLSQSINPPPDASQGLLELEMVMTALFALIVLLVAGYAVAYRNRYPLLADEEPVTERDPVAQRDPATVIKLPSDEERALAVRIENTVRDRQLYLQPELKVSSLAAELDVADYRVSRAISRAMGYSNFNQFINRYRIEHAQRLLAEDSKRSILAIGIDSGFASIGPFNRAFKSITGVTPRQYRAVTGRSEEAVCSAVSR